MATSMTVRKFNRRNLVPSPYRSAQPEKRFGKLSALSTSVTRETLSLTGLFGAFVFLQFTVLGLANHAGEGYLTTAQRDLVYYVLQVFVILGYLLHGLFFRFCIDKRSRSVIISGTLGLFLICGILLFAADRASPLNVVVSMAAALCVGGLGGSAHLRMSAAAVRGENVARCMGLGSTAAVVLQYLLQIRRGVSPLLPVFMLWAVLLFVAELRRPAPQTVADGAAKPRVTPPRRIVFSVVITATFILFACFYNESIHHLMIRSDYGSFNVYSWPRLMMVPVYLLFAAAGDRKNGRYVPIVSLCAMLIALLNIVLIGDAGAYWLNMCFFYVAIAAYTCYYLLTFWRLAPGTKHPAFWAPFGRMLDSAMVLFTGAIHLSTLSAPVVLGMDIAGVAMVILLMAVSGDFNLAAAVPGGKQAVTEKPEAQDESVMPDVIGAPTASPLLSPEETMERMRESYSLTAREAEVLRELVLTEDKQAVVSERLSIQVKTLQDYVTRLYRKTGVSTRAGLTDLYHETRNRT